MSVLNSSAYLMTCQGFKYILDCEVISSSFTGLIFPGNAVLLSFPLEMLMYAQYLLNGGVKCV